jgi:hypothetical protein
MSATWRSAVFLRQSAIAVSASVKVLAQGRVAGDGFLGLGERILVAGDPGEIGLLVGGAAGDQHFTDRPLQRGHPLGDVLQQHAVSAVWRDCSLAPRMMRFCKAC